MEGLTNELATVVGRHMKALGWERKALIDESGISPSQLSGYLNGTRHITKESVNRLCWAFAKGYEAQRKKADIKMSRRPLQASVESLDGMLNELLCAAGFPAVQGWQPDQVYARLANPGPEQPRFLRVGWTHYEQFAEAEQGSERPSWGIAVEVMNRIAQLLDAEVRWVRLPWHRLIPDLCSGTIDMIAPFMLVLPSRMFEVRFSRPLPAIELGVVGLIERSVDPTAGKMEPVFVRGEDWRSGDQGFGAVQGRERLQ